MLSLLLLQSSHAVILEDGVLMKLWPACPGLGKVPATINVIYEKNIYGHYGFVPFGGM